MSREVFEVLGNGQELICGNAQNCWLADLRSCVC